MIYSYLEWAEKIAFFSGPWLTVMFQNKGLNNVWPIVMKYPYLLWAKKVTFRGITGYL